MKMKRWLSIVLLLLLQATEVQPDYDVFQIGVPPHQHDMILGVTAQSSQTFEGCVVDSQDSLSPSLCFPSDLFAEVSTMLYPNQPMIRSSSEVFSAARHGPEHARRNIFAVG